MGTVFVAEVYNLMDEGYDGTRSGVATETMGDDSATFPIFLVTKHE